MTQPTAELLQAIKGLAEKATKGPFSVNPFSAYIDCTQLDEDGDPTPIAALAWPTNYRSEDETQANGELIALLLTERDTIIAALELKERVEKAGGYMLVNGNPLMPQSGGVSASDRGPMR